MSGKRNIEKENEKKKDEELFKQMLELYTMLPPWPWRRKKKAGARGTNYRKTTW